MKKYAMQWMRDVSHELGYEGELNDEVKQEAIHRDMITSLSLVQSDETIPQEIEDESR